MELTWSLDYCLACDKQTQGETYCSQSCRLADLESSSTWAGPRSTNTATSEGNKGSGFYLSPAINFTAYKTSMTSYSPAASQTASQTTSPLASYFPSHAASQSAGPQSLTPSSSHTSLSSVQSAPSQTTRTTPLSEHARAELLGYTNSFDHVRDWKRRTTWH